MSGAQAGTSGVQNPGAKTPVDGPYGFAVVDKDTEWTSHDVVAKARGVLGTRKVGHSGTLDPGATGVLVLGVGRATKLLRFITQLPKVYVAEVRMGIETDSLDADGEVTVTHDMGEITIEQIREAAQAFIGPIEQIPPMVSAIKIDGKRLHQLAREGKTVERKPRPVTIHRLEVSEVEGESPADVFRMEVECSSGTYIRTLGADIATALGGGAHLRALRRTGIGALTEDRSQRVEDVVVISPMEALTDYPAITVGAEVHALVTHGRPIPDELVEGTDSPNGPWLIVSEEEQLLAVHERVDGRIKPAVVLVSSG